MLPVLFAACGPREAPKDFATDELVIALENAPGHFDPRIGTDQASGRMYELMLDGLVTRDVDGNIKPDLAESWEILDQGRRYRFHLQPAAVFHDGRPLTARDVAWTFNSMLDGTVTSAKPGGFSQLERVDVIDETTVDFILSEPFGALLVNLTPWTGIVPDGVLPDDFNDNPVGSGPYRLVERSPDRQVFEAFSDHWGEIPKINRVIVREVPDATVRALELRKGSVQLVVNGLPPDVVADFSSDAGYSVITSPGENYQYLGLNLEDPILGKRIVRRALAHGIDRAQILSSVYQGLGILTETAMRPGHWSRNEDLETIPYDPSTARRLLDDAGFEDPDDEGPLTRFTLTYKTSTDATALLQAQVIQSMLAEIGIELQIRSYEFATFYSDVKQGNFQMFSLAWTGIADPDIYALILHSKSIPPAGANRGRYRNAEFDRLIDAGARLSAPDERRPFYYEAQEILLRDLPYVSLLTKANVAVMPCQLQGYQNFPSGELYGIPAANWGSCAG